MRLRGIGLTSFAVILLGSPPASAGLLDPVSIERRAYAYHERGWETAPGQYDHLEYSDAQDGVGVQPFSASVVPYEGTDTLGNPESSKAHQSSTISENTVSMTGSAGGTGSEIGLSWTDSNAYSYLKETFMLTSPSPFTFSFGWELTPLYTVDISVHLTGPSGDLFRQVRGNGSTVAGTWATQGYLEPGQYEYYVKGEIWAEPENYPPGDRTISFSADFTLTPEPATLGLAGLGALPLLRRRRTRK